MTARTVCFGGLLAVYWGVVGCQSGPATLSDARRQAIRLQHLKDQTEAQKGTILALKRKIRLLELELEAKQTRAQTKPRAREVSKQTQKLPAVGTKTLSPNRATPSVPADEGPVAAGEVLEDSRTQSVQLLSKARQLIRQQDPKKAMDLIRKFRKDWPDHVYSDHAQRLLIQAYLQDREFGIAAIEASRFEVEYPHSFLVKEVLLDLALAHEQMGAHSQAAKIRERAESQFPES